ncbi:processed acidic surface protein [Alkalicoccus luteus]|uniref:Processed acidic surface protein n=1 Tax=Alkalicoccus luteus TaxID=1237094 RepID=A0A969TV01_9BACI|nr:processed acidic surface protein [Alkalicoccus luteus]NJP39233.1 processed acidic surface protein [Alkalicoccus luteus]
MKLGIAFLFCLLLLPAVAFAAPSGPAFDKLLQDVSMTESEMREYLPTWGLELEDFEDAEELRSFLGPVLTESELEMVLADFELTEAEALELLGVESLLGTYRFTDDVYNALYEATLTPITDASLQAFLEARGMTYEELKELLEANDDSLSYYEFIEDLEWAVDFYEGWEDWDESEDFWDAESLALFEAVGLTLDEIDALLDHFWTLPLEDEAFWEELDAIAAALERFPMSDDPADFTASDLLELFDLFQRALQLFELDTSFYLVKDGEKVSYSLADLFSMTSTGGADLLIELYNLDGVFLADLLLKADLFHEELGSQAGGTLNGLQDLQEVREAAPAAPVLEEAPPSHVKEKEAEPAEGDRLPNTASSSIVSMLLFLLLAGAGGAAFRKRAA